MTDLSDFGGGNPVRLESDYDPSESREVDDRPSRCVALNQSTDDRCGNPVSHMTDSPLCSVHDRAEDVETIDGWDG